MAVGRVSVTRWRGSTRRGTVAGWRSLDGCASAATQEQVGALTQQRWGGCRAGVTVGLDLYQGGTHAWPAGSAQTPSAASEVWTFFRRSAMPPA